LGVLLCTVNTDLCTFTGGLQLAVKELPCERIEFFVVAHVP
jgi:hypothetical protein